MITGRAGHPPGRLRHAQRGRHRDTDGGIGGVADHLPGTGPVTRSGQRAADRDRACPVRIDAADEHPGPLGQTSRTQRIHRVRRVQLTGVQRLPYLADDLVA